MRTLAPFILFALLFSSAFAGIEEPAATGWQYDSNWPQGEAQAANAESVAAREVYNVLLKMLDRWNAHDLEGYLSVFWNSPDFFAIFQSEQYRGWTGFQQAYLNGFPNRADMGYLQPDRMQVKMLGPDLAFALTWWTLRKGNNRTAVVGTSTFNVRKFPDGWKIITGHTSCLEP
jgi:beta-aspartyl-peptidase (threonine type)